jgi:Flp pilus assembly protein TadG
MDYRLEVAMKARVCSFKIQGQGLVEFALIIPLLVLVVIGLFDLGYAVHANNLLTNAAREGARTGIILSNTDAYIRTRVKNTAPDLGLTDAQIIINPSAPRVFGNPITVTVNYTYTPITPLVERIVGGNLRLSATSSMVVEGVIQTP